MGIPACSMGQCFIAPLVLLGCSSWRLLKNAVLLGAKTYCSDMKFLPLQQQATPLHHLGEETSESTPAYQTAIKHQGDANSRHDKQRVQQRGQLKQIALTCKRQAPI